MSDIPQMVDRVVNRIASEGDHGGCHQQLTAHRRWISDLATEASMSITGFHRWFKAETGYTPQQWITSERVARARSLLESTDHSIEAVAANTGLGTASNLRLHFRRIVGSTHTAYCHQFARS